MDTYPLGGHPKERLERHAIGDINGNGHLDVVCVENLTGDLYWFENNGTPQDGQLWTLHEITVGGLAFAYDVDLADFNGNGYLDVAASGWKGNEIAIFENPGLNGLWTKHPLDDKMAEARTIRVADFTDNGRPDILATGADVPLVASIDGGVTFSPTAARFTYYDGAVAPTVSRFTPAYGPSVGGSVVLLGGTNFAPHTSLRCEVGGMAATLGQWHATAGALLGSLREKLEFYKAQVDAAKENQAQLDAKVEAVKATVP